MQAIVVSGLIGGVMGRVLASNSVDRGFEFQSDQTEDNNICIYCFCAKHAAVRGLRINTVFME